jgi:ATP-independent RNA helicase DbpA
MSKTDPSPAQAVAGATAVAENAFARLPLSASMQSNLQQLGYLAMTPIQAASLP